MIVTIDGPAGAGKSTVAKGLASRLGFEYLDTGAMYRAVTVAGLRAKCDFTCPDQVRRLLAGLRITMPPGKVILNGEDISGIIRSSEVTLASGPVSSNVQVREFLVGLQREIAQDRDIICEGRDQGTVVFPNACCKFYLTATAEERANRRFSEMIQRGENTTFEEILNAQNNRDQRDSARAVGPMKPAEDAILIDTTNLTLPQVIDRLEQEVRACRPRSSPTIGTI